MDKVVAPKIPESLIKKIGTMLGKNVITGIQLDSPGVYGVFGMESDDHTEEDVESWKKTAKSTNTYAFRPGTRIGVMKLKK